MSLNVEGLVRQAVTMERDVRRVVAIQDLRAVRFVRLAIEQEVRALLIDSRAVLTDPSEQNDPH